jgi:hypothetical protein
VTEELPVHVSRESIHSLDVPASLETHGPFDVVFVNHGQSVHVHVHLDDTLSKVASVDANNHYVEGESQRAVRVHVDTEALPDEPVLGKLKLVSGYGAQTRWVDVELSSPEEHDSPVAVDESLATPPTPEPENSGDTPLVSPVVPVLGLGVLAVVVALLAAVFVGGTLVVAGSLAVFAGVLVALFLLLPE